MSKTLILDIDNTLIEAMKELQPRSEAALRRWLAAGHRLVFASGKNACAFDDLITLLKCRKAGTLLPTAAFWQNLPLAGLSGWRASARGVSGAWMLWISWGFPILRTRLMKS